MARTAPRPAGTATTVEGVYRVDPVPQGKRFQGTWLILKGGKRLLLSYRPVPKYYAFIDKRVRVTGSYPKIDPRAQRIVGPQHFTVRTMTLLKGEKPGDPKRIPSPPKVASKADLNRYVGQWVLLYGKVRTMKVSPHESHYLRKMVVALPDGYEVSVTKRYLRNLRWDAKDPSKDVTVVGRVLKKGKGGALSVTFDALCQGHDRRCFVGYGKAGK